jgi:hypothetical protein
VATIKIEVVAGAQTTTNTKTVSGADLARFVAAYRKHAGTPAGATDAQVITAWSDAVFKQARNITRQAEADAAVLAVSEIGMT